MRIQYNVPGKERRNLAAAVAQKSETTVKYLGPPTFEYEVGAYRIDKSGTLIGVDNRSLVADLQGIHGFTPVSEEYEAKTETELYAEREMHRLSLENENVPDYSNRGQYGGDGIPENWEHGITEEEELGLGRSRHENLQGENGMCSDDIPEYFTYRAELSDPDWPDRMEIITATSDTDAIRQAWVFCTGEIILLELFLLDNDYNVVRDVEIMPARLTVEVPLTGFTPDKLDNLRKLVSAKAPLIKAAIGADDLPIQQNDDTLSFPWFRFTDDSNTVKAYSALVSHLCKAALEKKHVTSKEKAINGSPKYAMRCFLLSLGFIGEEYKNERKILLAKLSGSSAFRNLTSGGEDNE